AGVYNQLAVHPLGSPGLSRRDPGLDGQDRRGPRWWDVARSEVPGGDRPASSSPGQAGRRGRVVRLVLLRRMTGVGAEAALVGLGAVHGLNPGMGWLFAVALGLQERSRRALWRALPPLALG